jgi:hypothetical protein
MSKYRFLLWSLLAVFCIFLLILYWVLQQVSGTNLSARVSQEEPPVPQWECRVRCYCHQENPITGEFVTLPDSFGKLDICATADVVTDGIPVGGDYAVLDDSNTCADACRDQDALAASNGWDSLSDNDTCTMIGYCPPNEKQ